jgi:tRNA/rRNA methyltransferase
MATHFAADLVEGMEVFEDLKTALAPFQYVVGTTARLGSRRPAVPNLRKLTKKLIPISQHNRIALLFGPENWGLTNAELRLCHALVNIPTAGFASLNLAQAVMIVCYELFLSSREDTEAFTPRLATHQELEGMYDQLKDTFIHINFINPENPDHWMGHIRRFFSRLDMKARDVRMIRGICRQIEWYGSRLRVKGLTHE